MGGFPRPQSEIDILRRFVRALEGTGAQANPALENAKGQAEVYLARLEAPVRIAVAGLSRAGKSSLVNLLVGEAVIPTQPRRAVMPAVILRHAESYRTTAGWWDREEKVFDRLDIAAAMAEAPDIVSVGIDCEVLRDVWLMDLSDLEESGAQANALFVLSRLADMIVWCTNAEEPWTEEESHLWGLVPKAVQRRAILAVTNADHLPAGTLTPTLEQLGKTVGAAFRKVLPLATTDAWRALQGEVAKPEVLWAASGIEPFMLAMMEMAIDCRKAEVERVRRSMAQHLEPLLDQLPLEQTPPPPPVLDGAELARAPEPPPQSAAGKTEEAASQTGRARPALTAWKARMAAFVAALQSGEIAEDEDFLTAAQDAVSDFLGDLAAIGPVPASDAWVEEEFQRAQDLLILMQYESDEAKSETAALLLAQLTEGLAHSGASA